MSPESPHPAAASAAQPNTAAARTGWSIVLAAGVCFALLAWASASYLHGQALRQVSTQAALGIATMQQGDGTNATEQHLLAEHRARFISQTPPIAGIGRALRNKGIDPLDGTPLALWRTRLEQIAQAYVSAIPEVYQVRLIVLAEGGRELVRVEQDSSGTVRVVEAAQLQPKGERPYFTEALRLAQAQIQGQAQNKAALPAYVSPIELNQEHGQIEQPLRPTLSGAMAVQEEAGQVFGVLVVNQLAQPLLGALTTHQLSDVQEWVTNGAGQFLAHPQPGRAFAHELAAPGTPVAGWAQEFATVPEQQAIAPIEGLAAGTVQATLRAPDGRPWLMFSRTLRPAQPSADGGVGGSVGGLVLHSGLPVEVLNARAWRQAQGQIVLIWALELAVFGLLAFMLLRWRGSPLGLMADTVTGTTTKSDTPGRTLRVLGLQIPLSSTSQRPLAQVLAAALLPLLMWGGLTLSSEVGGKAEPYPFIFMLLPVLLASWWGGLSAGLAATLLAALGAWEMATPATPPLDLSTGGQLVDLLGPSALILCGLLSSFIQETVRRRGAQLAAANDRVARIVAAAKVGYWDFDLASGRVSWSPELLEFRGLKAGEFDGTLESVVRLTHPEDRVRVAASARESRPGEPYTIEFRVLRPDGQVRWIEARSLLIADGSGRPLRFAGTEVDITERKVAEAALRQFKSTLDSTHDCVFMFHPDTLQFFYVNQGACGQVGYSEAELLAMHPYDIKPEFPEAKFREMIAPLLDGRQPSARFETLHRHKDGHDVPVEVFLQFVAPAGEPPRFVAIVTDITERKAAEAALSKLSAQAQFVADHAPVLLAHCGQNKIYHFVNRPYAALFGREPAEIVGRHPRDILGEAAYLGAAPHMEAALAGESIQFELELPKTSHGPSTVLVRYEPERDDKQQIIGFVAAIVDISAIKLADKEIAARLAERTTLLNEVYHRVKNNLQVVSSLLMLQQDQTQSAETIELLQTSRDRVTAIAQVHEQLYRSQNFAELDFGQYLRELLEGLGRASAAQARGIELQVLGQGFALNLQEAVPCALLVNELVSNALKHAFPAGRSGRVWVELAQGEDGSRTLRVGDDGVGLAQPDHSDSTQGLGLTLAPRLSQQLQGHLERQASAVGTLWCLRLPAIEQVEELAQVFESR